MIRAAVCGLGIGLAHCAGYLGSEDARLVAVCDLLPERREKVGGTFASGSMLVLRPLFDEKLLEKRWEEIGVHCYSSLEEMLEHEEIDLVSLCTPDYLHAGQALRLLEARKHLLLEKPIALHLADAERVVEAARQAAALGIRSAIGYEFRVNPAILKARELVESGAIGRLEACSFHHYRTPFRRDKFEHWIQKRELSGGLIVEETSHWFDLARFLSGRTVESLHCVANGNINTDFDFEDIAYINGTLDEGGILQIAHSLTGFDFSFVIILHGRGGTIWCAMKEGRRSLLDARQTDYCAVVAWGAVGAPPEAAHVVTFGEEATEPFTLRAHVARVARAVARGEEVPCSLEEGLMALEASLAAGRSAEEGRVVHLTPRQAGRPKGEERA